MDYGETGLDRQQAMPFTPRGPSISDDHPVRHLEEILSVLDWSAGNKSTTAATGSRRSAWVMAG